MNRLPLIVLAVYFVLQALTLDYGAKINDIDFIRDFKFDKVDTFGTSLERNQISDTKNDDENLKKWILRFKLYSVEADEVYNIMALARIKPHEFKFDTHYYSYGGAYLYPLGLFYFLLTKIGAVKVLSLSGLLSRPDVVDVIYFYGRAFVLFSFVVSGYLLFCTLRMVTTSLMGLLCLGVYLTAPASIMFSQVLKPHWQALIWVNLALFLVVRIFTLKRSKLGDELFLGLALGFAVGSANTYAVFSGPVWVALAVAVRKKIIPWATLVRVPAIALFFFFLSNPYIILNYSSYQREAELQKAWLCLGTNWKYLYSYVKNSVLPGFGVAFGLFAAIVGMKELAKPSFPLSRLYVLGLVAPVVLYGSLTSPVGSWHINFRFIPYFLSCTLLLFALSAFKHKEKWLAAVLVAGILQMLPLKIAYFDENYPIRSTRLSAARWINENIPEGTSICTKKKSLAPYSSPPFDLSRYDLNGGACKYMVLVERQMDMAKAPDGFKLEKRFRPRFTPTFFPLVFSHVNPQISIYKKLGAGAMLEMTVLNSFRSCTS